VRHLSAVLEECKRRGVHLTVRTGNGLEVRGDLTTELREELSRCKPNVLSVLSTGRCIHELTPDRCKLCNGEVRRLIESQEESAL
jgi:hypothetical protein